MKVHPFLENQIIDFHIIGGGGNLFFASLPGPVFFSLLFSDHFVSPLADNLLLRACEVGKNPRKNVGHASVDLVSACK